MLHFDSKLIAGAGMDNKQVQVNIRLAEESADRLKALAESSGLKLGAFVERLIAGYRPDSNALQNDSSEVQDLRAVAEELRGIIEKQDVRLNALEVALMTGLDAGNGKIRVSVQAVENETVEADNDAPSHPADSSILPPLSPDELETLVKDTYRECDNKIGKTMEALREKGHGIGQPRLYKILGIKAWDGSRR